MNLSYYIFRLIKLGDIGLLGIYYLFGSIIIVSLLNVLSERFLTSRNKIKKLKNYQLFFQLSIQAALIMILSNILRHVIRSIPYPLEGYYGYKHILTKESNGGIIIAFAMFTSFSDFKYRVSEFVSRTNNMIDLYLRKSTGTKRRNEIGGYNMNFEMGSEL